MLRFSHSFSILCLFFVFTCPALVRAQQTTGEPVHKYYLEIAGIHTRADVEAIEKRVKDQPGILGVTTNDYPADYFIINSKGKITAETFRQWISNMPFELKQMEGDDLRRTEDMLYQIIKKKRDTR